MLGALYALPAAFGQSLTPQEERGKQIYLEGTSPRGDEIEAYIGDDLTPLPGFAAACTSCHGPDGHGRPEAGVIPSDITWGHLMKPYGHSHPLGRRHVAFTEASVREAIVKGHDSSGNELDPSMPVYLMSEEDLGDLIAYMKRLESDLDPGLSGEGIRIGTVLPTAGRMEVIGQAIREVLTAYFDRLNEGGGINQRKLQLVASTYDNSATSPLAATTRLLAEEDVFALLSPVVAGADREIAELVETETVPLIGPFTLFSPDPYALNDYTFFVLSGLTEQMRAMVDYAAQKLDRQDARVGILSPGEGSYGEIAEALEERCKALGWTTSRGEGEGMPASPEGAASLAGKLAHEGTRVVFFLGPGDVKTFLEAAAAIDWWPYTFLPGAFVRPEIFELPPSFERRVFLSYPTLPSDQTARGVAELEALLEAKGFSMRHRTSQVSALVAAKILVEGLKRAGRDLSRERLIGSLEKLNDFSTGLTPRLTYGANRRIGALGAYVVTVDLKKREFVPVGGWLAEQ